MRLYGSAFESIQGKVVKIDLQQIKELLGIVSSTDVTELTIEFGDQRITVKKEKQLAGTIEFPLPRDMRPMPPLHHNGGIDGTPPPVAPAVAAPPAPAKVEKPEPVAEEASSANTVAITSPMVGTFYQSPSPTAAAFVKVGDRVSVGQTVCIIEAMKLMNDLPSEVSGKIVKICAENGTTVEYGQTLFLVDPKG
ncbi:MAG: Biotin carboxyl carrier protein of acetyl-CoA carboxylase [bacterium ADurb.Bin425]|nr:MAG: Biotin carboxyl carrier protein of acetyl-CoA carboxylase [bacterium ADurb.Bin425]